jgi:hypothetical protein
MKFIPEYKHPNGTLCQKNDIYCGIYEPTPLTISIGPLREGEKGVKRCFMHPLCALFAFAGKKS